MPKTRAYLVTLFPGKQLPGSYVTSFALVGPPAPKRIIRTDSLADLRVQIQAFADESGEPVYDFEEDGVPVWIAAPRVADGGRKPNGFDREFSGTNGLFVPAVVAEAS